MLAGPNGSGKSSLVPQLLEAINLGVSVNADELEASLKAQPRSLRLLNLYDWQLQLTQDDLAAFRQLPGSQRLPAADLVQLQIEHNVLLFRRAKINSYLAAWVAELLRYYLVRAGQTVTFETVMSHPSKLEFLRETRSFGYRNYLYFVATNDPAINIARVKARVAKGGHAVATDKIVERYHRSLSLLRPALALTNRAYLFDNSEAEPQLIAEVNNGREVVYQIKEVPFWVSKALS